jgi:hypothetical protein
VAISFTGAMPDYVPQPIADATGAAHNRTLDRWQFILTGAMPDYVPQPIADATGAAHNRNLTARW